MGDRQWEEMGPGFERMEEDGELNKIPFGKLKSTCHFCRIMNISLA